MADPDLPTACEPRIVGAEWDAVGIPRSVGLLALDILGARSGAVIEDGTALYWLLPAGSAEGWGTANTRALSAGATLAVPPARRTVGPGPHWRICPGDDRLLTPAAALRAAVEDASGQTGGQPAPNFSGGRAVL
ncbi:hypothetical protein [Streptomyces sp. NRRL B-24572]|uniref:hypothetical protein n=1 Tax=Streptomyces sp. NRRL B-24572 TaxID=1962156 RepID=UPI000A36C998|nr:hypothetical protein [Streptomyces sp. NRRL B-24572]